MSEAGFVPVTEPVWKRLAPIGVGASAALLSAKAVAQFDESPIVLPLLLRATYGPTVSELASASSLGWDGYLQSQLNYGQLDDSAVESSLSRLTSLSASPFNIYSIYQATVARELIEAKILRAAFSRRQLYERMVEFWTDHFNIDIRKGECQWLKTIDDREVIRPHALGRFHDLLVATAFSPAMVTYLDNRLNLKQSPNENYARELMELHTIGDTNAFTQLDVKEVARCFTGWSVVGSASDPNRGQFIFQPYWHDQGPKRVLGIDIPANGGIQDGITVLEILSDHPATAKHLSTKLAKYFFGPNPPKTYIRAIQSAFQSSGGDIKTTLKTVFSSSQLLKAPPLLKRPFHLFVGQNRALQPKVSSTLSVQSALASAGHLPYHWGPPDGFPLTQEYWIGNLTPRWAFGMNLMANRVDGIDVPVAALVKQSRTLANTLYQIDARFLFGTMSRELKDRLTFYAGFANPLPDFTVRDLFGLTMASPEYQYC